MVAHIILHNHYFANTGSSLFKYLVCVLLHLCCSSNLLLNINHLNTTVTGNRYSRLHSVQVLNSHFVGTSPPNTYTNNSFNNLQFYFAANNTHPSRYLTVYSNITWANHLVRSHPDNTYVRSNNGAYSMNGNFLIIENNNVAYIIKNQLLAPILIYNVSVNKSSCNSNITDPTYTQSIQDGRFGYTNNEIILLIKSTVGYVVKYVYFNLKQNSSNFYLSFVGGNDTLIPNTLVNVSNTRYNKKLQYNPLSNSLFMVFQRRVVCYRADYLLQFCGDYDPGFSKWGQMDLSISQKHSDLLSFWIFGNLTIFNVSTYKTLGYWKVITNIISFANISSGFEGIKLQPPYIFVICNPNPAPIGLSPIYQFDFTISFNNTTQMYSGNFINSISVSDFCINGVIQLFNNNRIIVFHRDLINNTKMYDINWQPKYQCTGPCSACRQTYIINNSFCIKSQNILPQMSSPVIPLRYPVPIDIKYQNGPIDIVKNLNQSIILKNSLYYFSKILMFASVQILPQFFFTLFLFLDDIWYYKYHKTTYPLEVQFFMQQVNFINQIKYFMNCNNDKLNFIKEIQEELESNKTQQNVGNYQSVKILDGLIYRSNNPQNGQSTCNIDTNSPQIQIPLNTQKKIKPLFVNVVNPYISPEFIHIVNSTTDIFINQVLFNLVIYIVLKVSEVFIFYLSKNYDYRIFHYASKIKNKNKLSIFFLSFVENNIMRLVFHVFIQLGYWGGMVQLQIHNKIILAATFVLLFLLMLYCIIFYLVVNLLKFKLKKSQKSSTIKLKKLSFIGRKNKQGIRLLKQLTFNMLTHKLIRPFINAFFIFDFGLQIILLTLADTFCLVSVACSWKIYSKKLMFAYTLIYYLLFIVFDGYFAVKNFLNKDSLIFQKYFSGQFQQYFSFITLSILIITLILIGAIQIFYEFFKGCKKVKQILATKILPIEQTINKQKQRAKAKQISGNQKNKKDDKKITLKPSKQSPSNNKNRNKNLTAFQKNKNETTAIKMRKKQNSEMVKVKFIVKNNRNEEQNNCSSLKSDKKYNQNKISQEKYRKKANLKQKNDDSQKKSNKNKANMFILNDQIYFASQINHNQKQSKRGNKSQAMQIYS